MKLKNSKFYIVDIVYFHIYTKFKYIYALCIYCKLIYHIKKIHISFI